MYCNDQPSLQTITGDNGGNGDCTSGFSVGGDGSDTNTAIMVVEEAASALFSLLYNFFRNDAKSFWDTRLENVYAGKILRRVEVNNITVNTL